MWDKLNVCHSSSFDNATYKPDTVPKVIIHYLFKYGLKFSVTSGFT